MKNVIYVPGFKGMVELEPDIELPDAIDPEAVLDDMYEMLRFGGRGYSLLVHSLAVADIVTTFDEAAKVPVEHLRCAALLHDVGELVVGDMPAPVKRYCGRHALQALTTLECVVRNRVVFGIGLPVSQYMEMWGAKYMHRADKAAAAAEAYTCFRHSVGSQVSKVNMPVEWGVHGDISEYYKAFKRHATSSYPQLMRRALKIVRRAQDGNST